MSNENVFLYTITSKTPNNSVTKVKDRKNASKHKSFYSGPFQKYDIKNYPINDNNQRMAHATRTFSFDQNEKGIIIKSSVANPVHVNPKMMLSKGGNMSNDPCNRLGVTTNRQITWSSVIYFGANHQSTLTSPSFFLLFTIFPNDRSTYIGRLSIELNIAWV